MIAELRLTDPLLELTAGGVVVFGVFRRESQILESSRPPYNFDFTFIYCVFMEQNIAVCPNWGHHHLFYLWETTADIDNTVSSPLTLSMYDDSGADQNGFAMLCFLVTCADCETCENNVNEDKLACRLKPYMRCC